MRQAWSPSPAVLLVSGTAELSFATELIMTNKKQSVQLQNPALHTICRYLVMCAVVTNGMGYFLSTALSPLPSSAKKLP